MSRTPELAQLLEHPAIWRGASAARFPGTPTGFAALDASLPGAGWPGTGLIEILTARFGSGETGLLLPWLAALTRRPAARGCVWVAPPHLPLLSGEDAGCPLEPFAPALSACGIVLERVLVVRPPGTRAALWAFEQVLGSAACDVALAWLHPVRPLEIRRLQLAAERGRAAGVLFRPAEAAREPSSAVLRLMLEPAPQGVRVTVLKSRGGARTSIELALESPA